MRGLSPVVASGGHSSSRCAGLSLSWPLLLQSTGSRRAGSVIVARGPSRSAAFGILPDQGSNPCALHWQADSHPLRHQGSPTHPIFLHIICICHHPRVLGHGRQRSPLSHLYQQGLSCAWYAFMYSLDKDLLSTCCMPGYKDRHGVVSVLKELTVL